MHTLDTLVRRPSQFVAIIIGLTLIQPTVAVAAQPAEDTPAIPSISDVTPRNGTENGGNWVVIEGSGFATGTTVMFGDTAPVRVLIESDSRLRVYSPPLRKGKHTIWVATAAGEVSAGEFRVRTLTAEVVRLVNHYRASKRKCGSKWYPAAKPVRWDGTLARVARAHSQDMAKRDYFAHNSLDGTTPFTRMRRAGYRYRYAGENIAAGFVSANSVVNAWLESPSHCRVLMSRKYHELGVGIAKGGSYGTYWTQDYGRPR